MHASARPYAIAGSALLASSMIAVLPAVQPAALRVANMDVRLVDVVTDVTGALGNLRRCAGCQRNRAVGTSTESISCIPATSFAPCCR